jgi:hypothetical protein
VDSAPLDEVVVLLSAAVIIAAITSNLRAIAIAAALEEALNALWLLWNLRWLLQNTSPAAALALAVADYMLIGFVRRQLRPPDEPSSVDPRSS